LGLIARPAVSRSGWALVRRV